MHLRLVLPNTKSIWTDQYDDDKSTSHTILEMNRI